MTLDVILKEIQKAEKIVILTHETPDGDAIGSSLGLKLSLEKIGKKSDLIMTKHARTFDFLPASNEIKTESNIKNYDLAISLDCATIKRLDNREYFDNAKKTIVIDHHGSNNMYGDINYVNPVAPACAEIILSMLSYYDIEVDSKNGTCKRTLQTKTKANFELLKRVSDRLELLEDGKIAFSYITKQDLEDVNAEEGDHEGLVNIGRSIEGVEVSIFKRQDDEDEKMYKVSMRSGEYVNVSDVCLMFGGGGHPRAAGAKIQGTTEQVKTKLVNETKKYLK